MKPAAVQPFNIFVIGPPRRRSMYMWTTEGGFSPGRQLHGRIWKVDQDDNFEVDVWSTWYERRP